jgi:hypothetical protein
MRNNKRKTKYTQENLTEAVENLNNKTMKMKEILFKYQIPKTTLINNLERLRTRGRKPFLSLEVKRKLA